MATTDATIGKGTKVEFLSFGFVGQGTDLTFDGMGDVEDIDVTNFDSTEPGSDGEWGGMEYVPNSIGDPGTISMTLVYAQDQTLPAVGEVDTIRISLPLKKGYSQPRILSGSGYLSKRSVRTETRAAYTSTVTIRCSGVWTETKAVKVL